jgi:thiol-disulfide isomerase/thioredoxin
MRFVVVLGAFVLALAAGCTNNNGETDAGVDAAVDVTGWETSTAKKAVGETCAQNDECVSNLCSGKVCRKTCKSPTDCDPKQDCVSADDRSPAFCSTPKYSMDIGKSCAVSGSCPEGMRCISGQDAASAYCTSECADNAGCPATFFCQAVVDTTMMTNKKSYCFRRGWCGHCQHDGQCENGGKCFKQGSASFCTMPCNKGSTECPRVSDCTDIGGGDYQCVHRDGTCAGDGTMCSPCVTDLDCTKGVECDPVSKPCTMCLGRRYYGDGFCSPPCDKDGTQCEGSAKYQCTAIGLTETQDVNQCIPYEKDQTKQASCTTLSPRMEVGAVLPDFAMVGYLDDNGSNSLTDEVTAKSLKVVKLSDLSSGKIILFDQSAGWCGPCQQETILHAGLMAKYRGDGLRIYQVMNDGATKGSTPDRAFLAKWINGTVGGKPLNPPNACGIDPRGDSDDYNTENGVPLNMVLDAKTRKVLAKWYAGAPAGSTLELTLRKWLGLGPLPTPDAAPPKDAGVKDTQAAQ